MQCSEITAGGSSSPNPEEDDTLSVKEDESARSGESPSISGIDSSDDGTDES